MTTTPTDLATKRPADVTAAPYVPASALPDKGLWVLPFVFLGLPILFVVMIALGFVTTR